MFFLTSPRRFYASMHGLVCLCIALLDVSSQHCKNVIYLNMKRTNESRILVTGGSGFLGAGIVSSLLTNYPVER